VPLNNALGRLYGSNKLPVTKSFQITRFVSQFKQAGKLYAEEKKKIVEKWCDKDEDGKPKQQDDRFFFNEHHEEFNRDMDELLSIDALDKPTIKFMLHEFPFGLLSPQDLEGLQKIVEIQEK